MAEVFTVRPLADLGRKARNRGFHMQINHEQDTRFIAIRLTPTTPGALRACQVARQSSDPGQIEASVTYGALDDPWDAARECAHAALEMADEVLA